MLLSTLIWSSYLSRIHTVSIALSCCNNVVSDKLVTSSLQDEWVRARYGSMCCTWVVKTFSKAPHLHHRHRHPVAQWPKRALAPRGGARRYARRALPQRFSPLCNQRLFFPSSSAHTSSLMLFHLICQSCFLLSPPCFPSLSNTSLVAHLSVSMLSLLSASVSASL